MNYRSLSSRRLFRVSKHCPNSAICHKKVRLSLETISGKYAGPSGRTMHNEVMIRHKSATRKRHLFVSTNYGAPLRKIYVTLLTRKTKLSPFLALVPSRGVRLILRWCLLFQVRNLSTHWMLSLAPKLPSQSLVGQNGKELPRPPSCLHKKLLNFSYWLFSC